MSSRTSNNQKIKLPLIQKGKLDISFLSLVLIILTVGLVMLFSASSAYAETYYNNGFHFIIRQSIFAIGGVAGMIGVSKINYHWLHRLAFPIYGLALFLCVLVLALPTHKGFHRWIFVGPISFQPSEFAKFAVIVLFAHLISTNYSKMKTFKFGILLFGGLLLAVCGLVVVETHLSATVLIATIGLVMMYLGGIRRRYMLIGLGVAVFLIIIAVSTGVVEYAMSRLEYWRDPWMDASGKGYQTIQSLYAIGSGGTLGLGLGESNQKFWVPEPQNDFIFSIICEEIGFVGASIIIIIFALLVWRGFSIAMKSPDKFGAFLSIGLVFQVGLQTILNIFVVTNTIPNTGISLPFFSYGGSSLIMLLLEMGVVLSVSRRSRIQKT